MAGRAAADAGRGARRAVRRLALARRAALARAAADPARSRRGGRDRAGPLRRLAGDGLDAARPAHRPRGAHSARGAAERPDEPVGDRRGTASALRRAGRLRGAVYGTASPSGVRITQTSGLPREMAGRVASLLSRVELTPEGTRVGFGAEGLSVLAIPMPGTGDPGQFVAGVGAQTADEQGARVMATLARYGSVALENAELHARQREAIARLERQQLETAGQYTTLERILTVHDTLALAVLEGRGLASVLRSLGGFMEAEMAVVTVDDRVLARWPAEGELAWRPATAEGAVPRTVTERDDEAHLIGAPAVLDGDVLAWITARTAAPPGDVERAAVEYGALLVAVELLRERTALEVESRLRGGLLDDLFGDAAVPDLVRRRALAFGYDLDVASRVFCVEPASDVAERLRRRTPRRSTPRWPAARPAGAPRTSSRSAAARSRGRARDTRPFRRRGRPPLRGRAAREPRPAAAGRDAEHRGRDAVRRLRGLPRLLPRRAPRPRPPAPARPPRRGVLVPRQQPREHAPAVDAARGHRRVHLALRRAARATTTARTAPTSSGRWPSTSTAAETSRRPPGGCTSTSPRCATACSGPPRCWASTRATAPRASTSRSPCAPRASCGVHRG